MKHHKAKRRAREPAHRAPVRIGHALQMLRQARGILRDCGSKPAADYVQRALKSAEGAKRHAERIAMTQGESDAR